MSGPLKEPFEIKVYEIDDVERLQRRRQEKTDEVRMGCLGVFWKLKSSSVHTYLTLVHFHGNVKHVISACLCSIHGKLQYVMNNT